VAVRASGRREYRLADRILFGFFDFAHQRQYSRAEVFDLLLEVEEAACGTPQCLPREDARQTQASVMMFGSILASQGSR
jgi:hypothetical protein